MAKISARAIGAAFSTISATRMCVHVAELLGYVDDRSELVTWRQGRCLPYGEGITFWALGEIVKAHAGILAASTNRR